jgi:SAM-dependent methyltransferase
VTDIVARATDPIATTTTRWLARCPDCGAGLGPLPPLVDGRAALSCAACGAGHHAVDGVWRFVPAGERERVERFLVDYHTVRRAEGRGSLDPAYYLALPDTAAADPLAWQWSMRARTWRSLERHEVASWAPGSKVLDLGAGVGWLANRLGLAGHHPVAVDVSIDDLDGLVAARHYPGDWPRVQAMFDHLPFADGEADVVLFNASLHYSVDYHVTLAEARRVLRPGGRLVVLDSPVYRRERSGQQMVAERHADFERRFGTRSDSVPSIEYLTGARLAALADSLGVRWRTHRTWYGWRWAARPLVARLKRRRAPSRFVLLVASVAADQVTR